MSIIKAGLPILAELINLVNSVIIFLSQMTLSRWLTFLLKSQTFILTVLLFWIYLFLPMLVFVLQWLSLQWESRLSIKFTTGCPISSHSLWLFSCWLGWSSWSFGRWSMGGSNFRQDCIILLSRMISKLQEGSPLKYQIVCCMSCIAQMNLIHKRDECILKFSKIVEKLYQRKLFPSKEADDLKLLWNAIQTSFCHLIFFHPVLMHFMDKDFTEIQSLAVCGK